MTEGTRNIKLRDNDGRRWQTHTPRLVQSEQEDWSCLCFKPGSDYSLRYASADPAAAARAVPNPARCQAVPELGLPQGTGGQGDKAESAVSLGRGSPWLGCSLTSSCSHHTGQHRKRSPGKSVTDTDKLGMGASTTGGH